MAFFEFPHTRTYDSDLGWLISAFNEISQKLDQYLENAVITFADPITWDITEQYGALTMVVDSDGTAYLSKQAVPAGVNITNTNYWLPVFNYDDNINTLRSQIAYNAQNNPTTAVNLDIGDLVFWNGYIYKVLVTMPAGTAFIIGTNITQYTVDEKINNFKQDITNLYTNIGNVSTSLINETNNRIAADNAILRRIPWKTPEDYGAVGDGVTDDSAAFQAMFNDAQPSDVLMCSKETYLCVSPLIVPASAHDLKLVGGFSKSEYTPTILTSLSNDIFLTFRNSGVGLQNICIQGSGKNNGTTLIMFDADNDTVDGNIDAIVNMVAVFNSQTGIIAKGRNLNVSNCVLSTLNVGIQYDNTGRVTEERGMHVSNDRFHDVNLCIQNNIDITSVNRNIFITNNFADFSSQLFHGYGGGVFINGNLIDAIGSGILSGAVIVDILSGLYADNVQRTVVTNNKLIGWASRTVAGVMIEDNYSPEVIVQNNIISNCQGFGVALRSGSKGAVVGNTIINCGLSSGYYAINPVDATVTGVIANNTLISCTNTIRTNSMTNQNNVTI